LHEEQLVEEQDEQGLPPPSSFTEKNLDKSLLPLPPQEHSASSLLSRGFIASNLFPHLSHIYS